VAAIVRKLTDKQVDEITSPDFLRKLLPGKMEQKYDAVHELRISGIHEVSKYSKKEYGGWRHVASVPKEVMWAVYEGYTPEEISLDGGRLLLNWINRHPEIKTNNGVA
jgi:hypothetical protein